MNEGIGPRLQARMAGFLYLLVIAGGAFGEAFVRQRLIAPGDAPATAANLLANEEMFRLGFAADLLPLLCNVGLAVIFWSLFRIVSRPAAAMVVLFSMIGTAVQAAALLFHVVPLLLLKGNPGLHGLAQGQLESLAYLSLRMQTAGYTISLVFFGCFGLCIGYAILRSGFLPRVLGALMMVAGACYFTNSMLFFLAPGSASMLWLMPCLLGEGSLALWLTLVGLNEAKWRARAAAS